MANQVAEMFLYNPQNFAGNEKGLKIHEQIYPLSFFRDDTDFFPAVPGRSVQIRCPAAETRKESGPSENAKPDETVLSASRDIFAMDTYMTIQCYGDQCEEAADAAVLEIERLDSLLSVGNPESEIIMLKGSGTR